MWSIFRIYDQLMIVYPVCMFYDQQSYSLAMETLNFKKGIFLIDNFFKI